MTDEAPALPSTADRFRRMAERIDHNESAEFGGAFLIVPPRDGGDVIETLILDTKQDPVQYWQLLKAKCDHELVRLDAQGRSGQAFGRR